MRILLLCLLLSVVAAGLGWFYLNPAPVVSNSESDALTVSAAMAAPDLTGYARAATVRPFIFPADHGAHPDFRVEWWYLTGNLWHDSGRRFGYQFTLFRIALSPTPVAQDSAWRTRQLYMGHFAVSDMAEQQHYDAQRFSRGALGLAGVTLQPLTVWLEDWQLQGTANELFPLQLQAQTEELTLHLQLTPEKPLVLQGQAGLSQKSAAPGNASYYYSYTRLASQGQVRIGEETWAVQGQSWLDREWSTSALGPDQTGWDWFALQLSDGYDVMFYRLRHTAGGMHPYSQGVLVDADGQRTLLTADTISATPLEPFWQRPAGGYYPIRWQLTDRANRFNLTVSATFADQAMDAAITPYWEGAVDVQGTHQGQAVTGVGYLEMTAYE